MTENRLIERAVRLARLWHINQVDKAGMPYVLHALRVGLAGKNTDEMIVGFLHDLLEDTLVTLAHLQEEGFKQAQITAVYHLTRPPGFDYHAYIQILGGNPLARAVKLNDLEDNLRPDRAGVLSDDQRNRYLAAQAYLRSVS